MKIEVKGEMAEGKFFSLGSWLILFSLAILFFCAQPVQAAHHWVWSGENIEVYVEDTSLEWETNGKEFSIKVIDVVGKNAGVSYLNFYERDGVWYYGVTGKREIMPVSYANASGNILDFAKNFSPVAELFVDED